MIDTTPAAHIDPHVQIILWVCLGVTLVSGIVGWFLADELDSHDQDPNHEERVWRMERQMEEWEAQHRRGQ